MKPSQSLWLALILAILTPIFYTGIDLMINEHNGAKEQIYWTTVVEKTEKGHHGKHGPYFEKQLVLNIDSCNCIKVIAVTENTWYSVKENERAPFSFSRKQVYGLTYEWSPIKELCKLLTIGLGAICIILVIIALFMKLNDLFVLLNKKEEPDKKE